MRESGTEPFRQLPQKNELMRAVSLTLSFHDFKNWGVQGLFEPASPRFPLLSLYYNFYSIYKKENLTF